MSEYDFVYDPLTPEEIEFRKKNKELDDFTWAIKYEDMLIFKKYVKKYPEKFSNFINQHIKENP